MPFLSCILLSHNKPAHVGEAIDSLLAQTFADWEAIVFDSGVLHDRGFYKTLAAMNDPRIRLARSWETEEIRRTKTIASWCFNECFRKKMLTGSYVTYLCDDDLYYPNAFQSFHDCVCNRPEVKAMYASVDMTGVTATGEKLLFREMLADKPMGSCIGSGPLDCRVDYLQLCHQIDLFDLFPDGDFWPEDRAVISHADGIFLEKIGALTPIYPVAAKIGENRKVPDSLNTGGERLELLLEVCRREQEIHRLEQLLTARGEELALLRSQHIECLRYRIADKVNGMIQRVPALHRFGKMLLLAGRQISGRRSA